ncbi:MAG TPA: hypothetical protein VF329_13580 [Gammaproteobacteria bacterium]
MPSTNVPETENRDRDLREIVATVQRMIDDGLDADQEAVECALKLEEVVGNLHARRQLAEKRGA